MSQNENTKAPNTLVRTKDEISLMCMIILGQLSTEDIAARQIVQKVIL